MVSYKIFMPTCLFICLIMACAKPATTQTWKIQKLIHDAGKLTDTVDLHHTERTLANLLTVHSRSHMSEVWDTTYIIDNFNKAMQKNLAFRFYLQSDGKFSIKGDPHPFFFLPPVGWHNEEILTGTWKRENDLVVFIFDISPENMTRFDYKQGDIRRLCTIRAWDEDIIKLRAMMDDGYVESAWEIWFEKATD